MLLTALSTGNMIGLSVIAATFIGFALICSLVIPRRHPDFPGEKGIGVFAIVCVALFIAQLTAIIVFDVEKKAKPAAQAPAIRAQALPQISK